MIDKRPPQPVDPTAVSEGQALESVQPETSLSPQEQDTSHKRETKKRVSSAWKDRLEKSGVQIKQDKAEVLNINNKLLRTTMEQLTQIANVIYATDSSKLRVAKRGIQASATKNFLSVMELVNAPAGTRFDSVKSLFVGVSSPQADVETVYPTMTAQMILDSDNSPEFPDNWQKRNELFWPRQTFKVPYEKGQWPKQEGKTYDNQIIREAGSYCIENEFGENLAATLRHINPIQVVAEVAQAWLTELTLNRIERIEDPAQADNNEDGVSYLTMPQWPEGEAVDRNYYVVVHYKGYFKKIAIPADVISQKLHTNAYFLVERELADDPSLETGWHRFPVDEKSELEKIAHEGVLGDGKKALHTQDFAQFRSKKDVPFAADMAIVIADESQTDLDHGQRSVTDLTYGMGIPVVVRLGFAREGNGVSLKKMVTKSSHVWHDGAIVQRALGEEIAPALERCGQKMGTAEASRFIRDFDARLDPEADQALLSEKEPPVARFTFDKQQARLDRIEAKQGDKIGVNAHSLFSMAMMAALGINDAHFLEKMNNKKGLAPVIVPLNPQVASALVTKDGKVTRDDMLLLLEGFDLVKEQRQSAKNGLSIPVLLATISRGSGSVALQRFVQGLGRIADADRAKLITESSCLISTLFGKSSKNYQKNDLYNAGFTSAISEVYSRTAGAIQINDHEIAVTVRFTDMDDVRFTNEQLKERFVTAYTKLLDLFDPQEKLAQPEETWQ